ncbi:hypothetical protein GCM10025872_02270 [Barrientosiimonas endolithica]|uniref:Bacterial type II secretion system protein E domain-containing protein n=1 Tax=Barrientosiimonas endolithica TaxID=1535208 RepID=A0ABM8H6X1_9MICO|nr:hypothetical protein GCM10025872_02270 [Barrientosiimonas endolithica]
MTPTTPVGDSMWRHIRAGRQPSAAAVDDLAADDATLLGDRGRELQSRLAADLLGAGPLEELLQGPGVTDVLVNGTDGVFVDTGEGLVRTDLDLTDADHVRRLAVRLAGLAGRRLDDSSPYVDGLLPGACGCTPCCHRSCRAPRTSRCACRAPPASTSMRWGAAAGWRPCSSRCCAAWWVPARRSS